MKLAHVASIAVLLAAAPVFAAFEWPKTLAGLDPDQQAFVKQRLSESRGDFGVPFSNYNLDELHPTEGESAVVTYFSQTLDICSDSTPSYTTYYVQLYVTGARIREATSYVSPGCPDW